MPTRAQSAGSPLHDAQRFTASRFGAVAIDDRRVQLGFPWCREELKPTTLVSIGRVDVTVSEGYEEVELRLAAEADAALSIRIRLAHPAWARIDDWPCDWDMQPRNTGEGLFAEAVHWAWDFGAHAHELGVRAACARVSTRAAELADRDACATASRVTPHARMFTYAALLRDPQRRVAETVVACPGLLALAAQRQQIDIIDGIQAGKRLRDLVGVATRASRMQHPLAGRLVRGAPPAVTADEIVGASCVDGLDINDMPLPPGARTRWFRALAAWNSIRGRLPVSLGAFVSKHGASLSAIAETRNESASTLLAEICDWLLATRARTPSRSTNPQRVLDAVNEWHLRLWTTDAPDPDAPLMRGPEVTLSIPDLVVAPIETAGALYAEGRRMRHCVGNLAMHGVAGRMAFYHARCASQHVTIAIECRGLKWSLVEAAGFANAPIRHRDLIERWIDILPRWS